MAYRVKTRSLKWSRNIWIFSYTLVAKNKAATDACNRISFSSSRGGSIQTVPILIAVIYYIYFSLPSLTCPSLIYTSLHLSHRLQRIKSLSFLLFPLPFFQVCAYTAPTEPVRCKWLLLAAPFLPCLTPVQLISGSHANPLELCPFFNFFFIFSPVEI